MQTHAELWVHFIVALPGEAKALIAHYRLKRRMDEDSFPVFERDGITLTVCGIGKAAVAAAVAYTHVLFGKQRNVIWLNVGVAGHREQPLGSVWIAHRITDADTGRQWYPPLCFRAACPSADLRTVSRPETEYADSSLYDMEASAFFETASRFSTTELVHCLKIVSDNRDNSVWSIDPARAGDWIRAAIVTISDTEEALRRLAKTLAPSPAFDTTAWAAPCHLTVQQRRQVVHLLDRWQVLTEGDAPPAVPALSNARQLIAWLTDTVESLPVRLKPTVP
jgi:adenosylhomocysteine nucleosidase